jgi:hypothetical protein
MKRALFVMMFATLLAAGCADDDDETSASSEEGGGANRQPARGATGTTPATRTPPRLEALDPPVWPPFGPTSRFEARCSDDVGVRSLSAQFKHSPTVWGGGSSLTASFLGRELGEGQGLLRISCCDSENVCAERRVQDFFVDLTPPEIEPERLVASPLVDGELAIWIRDAWVLGSLELSFGGKTLRHELPKVYPSTLGNSWDVSRITFAAKDLPRGAGKAVLIARDAAGNETTKQLAVRIDAAPPTLAIVAPATGATVSGSSFPLKLEALDQGNPVPVTIDVWVGGARIAQLAGPTAEISIDTSTLSSGPTEVRAIARDDAGNESTAATVFVEVP